MDTSSPFAASRRSPQPQSISLSQLLAHIRAADQTEAFVQEVTHKSPNRSVATTRVPPAPSFVSRSSKRSGIIVNKRSRYSSDSESDSDTGTAVTCSSIGSVSRRTIGGAAVRKRSLCSAWFDEDEEPNDTEDMGDGGTSDQYSASDGESQSDEDPPGDSEDDVSTIAQRAASRAGLNPSKRSLENLKNLSMFDPSFSFSRICVTSPVIDGISPLENWFFHNPEPYLYKPSRSLHS